MTTRPPFHYETPADIVRICGFGLQALAGITSTQYADALAVVNAAKAVVVFAPMDWDVDDGSDTGLESNLDFGIWYRANKNADYDTRKDLAK